MFEVAPGSIPCALLHFAIDNARHMAANGNLKDDPQFATFISAARRSEDLALLNGVLNPEDSD